MARSGNPWLSGQRAGQPKRSVEWDGVNRLNCRESQGECLQRSPGSSRRALRPLASLRSGRKTIRQAEANLSPEWLKRLPFRNGPRVKARGEMARLRSRDPERRVYFRWGSAGVKAVAGLHPARFSEREVYIPL